MNLKKLFMPNWYKCRRNLYLFLIVLLVFGTWMVQPARADLTNVKDTLSDSRPSTVSNHTISFDLSDNNDIEVNDTIVITFPVGFDLTSIDYEDIDLFGSDGSGDQTLAAAAAAGVWGVQVSGQVITFSSPSSGGTLPQGGATITIEIGTNATFGSTGSGQITNPATPGSYTIDIAANGADPDTGALVVAIISGVTVTATIAESLTFTIAGIANTACTLGNAVTAVTTTATAVPFGDMNANTFKKGCQLLTVNTNAGDGYTMTSQENDQMTNAGLQTIPDTTCDNGLCTETTGAVWATASANHGLGHTCFGVNCVGAYSAGSNYRQFASIADTETAQTMMSSSSPVTNATSTVVYQLSVSGSQPSGNYTNTVVYITTAQFD